ncbi:chemotaxis protein CheW [Actinoplanes sp. NEAU-A12]|uniref:histidine kinase n=1 Tax=Actinoplanes sandaracinus TaxID=3045177 RepID=A0ABT6WU85_9ACTN|nr:chemotaxis protein CheW [Actinoplanes sandaracinus]MDI6103297.1 chemotaxis protein CheW [Actinoplanes sandaracinus]
MNPLLAQFLAETDDLLSQAGRGLLRLERVPGDPEPVNEVFRAAHTVKGSSGLFDLPELTRLTHATEDLLAEVRAGRLGLDSGMTGDLLAAFDLIRGWLAHVSTHERLPSSAGADAAELITRLRAPLGGEATPPTRATKSGALTRRPGGGEPPPEAEETVTVPVTPVIEVGKEKMDRLVELAAELNVATNGLTFLAVAAEEEFGSRMLSRRIKDQHAGMHRIAEQLRAAVTDVRMVPLSVAFGRFPPLVRDLSRRLGTTVELVTEGEDTVADADVIEALGEPLTHLVRNSVVHGIEPSAERVAAGKAPAGRLTLTAVADRDAVIVEVSDDGRGAGPDFTTAAQIPVRPGRGAGMDAVRAGVEKLGGAVTIRSEPGEGTAVRLRVPLSTAVTRVMVVGVGGQRFGVPVDLVVETARVPAGEMGRVLRQEVMMLRGDVVPVVDLARVLDMPWSADAGADRRILVVSVNGRRTGLLVERFHREADVVLKPMEGLLAYADEFSGTALLGDGLVLLVLDMSQVLGRAARIA